MNNLHSSEGTLEKMERFKDLRLKKLSYKGEYG
jgi:hypothetical protein